MAFFNFKWLVKLNVLFKSAIDWITNPIINDVQRHTYNSNISCSGIFILCGGLNDVVLQRWVAIDIRFPNFMRVFLHWKSLTLGCWPHLKNSSSFGGLFLAHSCLLSRRGQYLRLAEESYSNVAVTTDFNCCKRTPNILLILKQDIQYSNDWCYRTPIS